MDGRDQVREFLNRFRNTRTLILGMGSELKGDDGAGPLLCGKLKQAGVTAEIIDAGTVPENYIQSIVKKSPQNILVVDAIDFDAPTGGIKVFQPDELSSFAFSTHSLSPHLFIDMIKGQIDVDVYIIGIKPGEREVGGRMSAEVSRSVDELAGILSEIFSGYR